MTSTRNLLKEVYYGPLEHAYRKKIQIKKKKPSTKIPDTNLNAEDVRLPWPLFYLPQINAHLPLT